MRIFLIARCWRNRKSQVSSDHFPSKDLFLWVEEVEQYRTEEYMYTVIYM